MKHILVLGAGQSAAYLIDHLLSDAESEDWFVTVGDADGEIARQAVGEHSRGDAIGLDINDAELRSTQIGNADVVVNMLPAAYQDLVAWDCVNLGRHMLSVSYRDRAVRELDPDAKRKGVLLLFELGLDPGIDHMSAMSFIRSVEKDGGTITGFRSYGTGLPAPEQPHNPLRYVITWDPRNVVMSGSGGAQYMEDRQIKIVPYHHLFQHTWPVEIDGVGSFEAYANRDSLSYMQSFGLEKVHTMLRGTLRYPGWGETWGQIVRLGLPNEDLRIPDLSRRSPAEVVEMFLPVHPGGVPLEQRVARFLQISPTGRIMENMRWLGLFSTEPLKCRGETSARMLIHLLENRLALSPGEQDMVILLHELDVTYPDGRRERRRSTLVEWGEPGGFTAMSRLVGLPVAASVRLLLHDRLALTGGLIPTHPAIYGPVLDELSRTGVRFTETRTTLEPTGEPS